MKLSFDTVGLLRMHDEPGAVGSAEMSEEHLTIAFQACLAVRRLLGDAARYVDVLKVRFFYPEKSEFVKGKFNVNVDDVWFAMTGVIRVGQETYPIHEEGGAPPINPDRSDHIAEDMAYCINQRMQKILERQGKNHAELVRAVKTIRTK